MFIVVGVLVALSVFFCGSAEAKICYEFGDWFNYTVSILLDLIIVACLHAQVDNAGQTAVGKIGAGVILTFCILRIVPSIVSLIETLTDTQSRVLSEYRYWVHSKIAILAAVMSLVLSIAV